jgi:ABC-2 type transport system ATP-binding protein
VVAIDGTGSMTTRTAAPVVQVERLGRSFGDFVAVSGLTFDVPKGVILGIIGPSGSGKTTTIRMITGSLEPTEGEVTVLGERPDTFRRATRERIGYMPQRFILYPDLTVGENVDFVGTLFGLLMFRRRKRVQEVLRLVDLWDVRKRRAKDLSGGMQRRLELACALVHEPDLLILDEPTAGIDPILRQAVWGELHRLRERGVTSLVTTQYVTEAEECDAVALISEGRLIALASPTDLRRQALGGDIIEVTTTSTFDAGVLRDLESVRGVRQLGLRDFRVVVTDAGTATPEVVDAVASGGGEVEAAREVHPTFEEVFALLVERDRVENGTDRGEPEPPIRSDDGRPRPPRDGEAGRPERRDEGMRRVGSAPLEEPGDGEVRAESQIEQTPDHDRMDARWAEPVGADAGSKTLEAAEGGDGAGTVDEAAAIDDTWPVNSATPAEEARAVEDTLAVDDARSVEEVDRGSR